MIFSSQKKNFQNILGTPFPEKQYRGYFLKLLENFRILKEWLLEILFGLFTA